MARSAFLHVPRSIYRLLRGTEPETTLLAVAKPRALLATLGSPQPPDNFSFFFTFSPATPGVWSLGAVMVLMTWLYVTEFMLLLGAEVNVPIQVAAVRAHAVPAQDQAPADGFDFDQRVPFEFSLDRCWLVAVTPIAVATAA